MTNIWDKYWFRISQPIQTIKNAGRRIRWSVQRIKRGWADCDTWNLDYSLAQYLYGTLNYLANNTYGWPSYDFDTYDDWVNALRSAAQHMYDSCEENDTETNPYSSDNFSFEGTPEEQSKKFWEWEKERQAWRNCQKDLAFDFIKKYFYDLWD